VCFTHRVQTNTLRTFYSLHPVPSRAGQYVAWVPALSAGYEATRARIAGLVAAAPPEVPVPACPGWQVRDLVAHLSGLAEAVAAGEAPGDDWTAWVETLVAERRAAPLAVLLERWEAVGPLLPPHIDGGAHGLFVDAVVHEHDLRGALDAAGDRGVPEVRATVQLQLDDLGATLKRRGIGALVIDSGPVTWTSHFARSACTLRADPWEATRVLANRRTPEEVGALVVSGDVEPFLGVLEARRPFPVHTLGEAS
jgi:uncharacterized protein (TIGR03083 family)